MIRRPNSMKSLIWAQELPPIQLGQASITNGMRWLFGDVFLKMLPIANSIATCLAALTIHLLAQGMMYQVLTISVSHDLVPMHHICTRSFVLHSSNVFYILYWNPERCL